MYYNKDLRNKEIGIGRWVVNIKFILKLWVNNYGNGDYSEKSKCYKCGKCKTNSLKKRDKEKEWGKKYEF